MTGDDDDKTPADYASPACYMHEVDPAYMGLSVDADPPQRAGAEPPRTAEADAPSNDGLLARLSRGLRRLFS
jgi:hypothetical protein